MANVLTVVWSVILYVVTASSIAVWVALMLPNPVERARQQLETKPLRCLFMGALFAAAVVLIFATFLGNATPGPVKLIGWILMAPALVGGTVGNAAFARLIAGRIAPQMGNRSPILALVGGAVCTTISGLLPIVGWLIFLPVIVTMALGAGLPALFQKKEAVPVSIPTPVAAPTPVAPATPERPADTSGFLLPLES